MKELISVIVPVYNVEKYLRQCVESIINQTYSNIEIILIDDGSLDNSSSICDDYLYDSRISVYHKNNGGLSDARNYGLKKSSGEVVLFVDSDDWLHPCMIETLYNNLCTTGSDISICGSYKYYSEKCMIPNQIDCPLTILDRIQAIEWIYDFDHFGVGVWNKLFRKRCISEIPFPIGRISEDYFVMYKYFINASKICYESTPLYYYRQRQDSITKKKNTSFDVIDAHLEFLEYAKSYEPRLIPCSIHACVFSHLGVYDTTLKNKDCRNRRSELRSFIVKNFGIAIKYERNKSRRLQLFLFCFFPFFYPLCFKLYRNHTIGSYSKR